MNETELLRYQIESYNKATLIILEDINKRLNILEDRVNNLLDELKPVIYKDDSNNINN